MTNRERNLSPGGDPPWGPQMTIDTYCRLFFECTSILHTTASTYEASILVLSFMYLLRYFKR